MFKVTLLYGRPDDPAAFERYYAGQHSATGAGAASTAVRGERSRLIPLSGASPPFYRMAELWFESRDEMEAAMASEAMAAAIADLDNFATGGVVIFASQLD